MQVVISIFKYHPRYERALNVNDNEIPSISITDQRAFPPTASVPDRRDEQRAACARMHSEISVFDRDRFIDR